MGDEDKFEKVSSLRFGEKAIWCYRKGQYRLEGPDGHESLGVFLSSEAMELC